MQVIALALTLLFAAWQPVLAQTGAPSAEARRANQHYANGWTFIRAESWSEAVREFEQAINTEPKFALAYYSLGRAYMGQRDFPRAIAAYQKCRELFVNDGSDQFTGQRDMRQQLTDRIAEYQMALDQARARSNATASQSQALYVRNLQMAITRLEQARDRSNSFTVDIAVPYFVPMALGAAHFRSSHFAEAEREYKEAIASNPASGETHNNLAVLYLTIGRYEDAENEVKAAEKVGFKINENLKSDIRAARRTAERSR